MNRTFVSQISSIKMNFHTLKVREISAETPDAKTFTLDVPPEQMDSFRFTQGQYITLKVELNGQELRRSYSMSSSPLDQVLSFTVKKIPDGRVSSHLHDCVEVGSFLNISTPEGRFFVPLDPEKRRVYYLFAAGSGITPMMSIVRTTLEAEPMSSVFLLYGSRNEDHIIFQEQLDELSRRYHGQLYVEHILSQPKKEVRGERLFGLVKKKSTNWQGKTGRIDGLRVNAFLEEHPAPTSEKDVYFFICGPDSMPDAVKVALLAKGIAPSRILTEHFVSASQVPGENISDAASADGATLVVTLKGRTFQTRVPKGATILDVLVKEQYDPPYSCTSGACSTCMAKVLEGTIEMDVCYALDPDEVSAGYCLTCQAKPTSSRVEITFDQ